MLHVDRPSLTMLSRNSKADRYKQLIVQVFVPSWIINTTEITLTVNENGIKNIILIHQAIFATETIEHLRRRKEAKTFPKDLNMSKCR